MLEKIFTHYFLERRSNPDEHIKFCVNQKNIADAIEVAAKSEDEHGKVHPHQRRPGRIKLIQFAESLAALEPKILSAGTFDEIHKIVQSAATDKIGELTIYDVAHRIGAYRNKLPETVYIHSGTRIGAANLLGRLKGKRQLLLKELPSPFTKAGLTPAQIEDILCIYKKTLLRCVKTK